MAPRTDPEWSPALRGFDEVFGFLGRGAHDYFKLNDPDDPIYRGTNVVSEIDGYLTDRLGRGGGGVHRRATRRNPFFLYLAFNAVHAPLQAPADEIAKFNTGNADRNTLLAMGKRMDDAIGKVVAKLKSEGVWENTLLFFISDNGGPLAQTADNTPLRGGKHRTTKGGIRVPFLVCWPAKLKPGESQAVVSSLDILPTALAAAGLPCADDKPLDGIEHPADSARRDARARRAISSGAPAATKAGGRCARAIGNSSAKRPRSSLFDLDEGRVRKDRSRERQCRRKLAELTKLHDAWLAQMANPVKDGEKKWTPGMTTAQEEETHARAKAEGPRRRAREEKGGKESCEMKVEVQGMRLNRNRCWTVPAAEGRMVGDSWRGCQPPRGFRLPDFEPPSPPPPRLPLSLPRPCRGRNEATFGPL